jgi:hypothetical protein
LSVLIYSSNSALRILKSSQLLPPEHPNKDKFPYLSTSPPLYLSTSLPLYLSASLPLYLSTSLPLYLSASLRLCGLNSNQPISFSLPNRSIPEIPVERHDFQNLKKILKAVPNLGSAV